MADKEDFDFATTNLNTLVKREIGDCKNCGKEEKAVCEHGQCRVCECKHYCWLD